MKQIYAVPVIPNNLRHKETIIQIADALNYVNHVFEDILNRINERIDEKQKHVADLKDRMTTVHDKVVRLTKTKKATQVFSNTKYPFNKENQHYTSVFSVKDKPDVVLVRTKIKLKEPILNEQSNNILQFYHVKNKNDNLSVGRNMSLEGLGEFPENVQLINELLLFNTQKNPYKKYEMSDPFSNNFQNNSHLNDEMHKHGPDEAPLSMTQRNGVLRESKENYFYSPDLGDVPTIDVPLDLPDLPGVADDLRYLMELGPGIAPSVQTTPILPELPQVINTDTLNTSEDMIDLPNTSDTIDITLPDLPIPEDIPDLPPPVVPPPEPEIPPPVVEIPEETSTPKPSPPVGDVSAQARANLMEEIRKGGKLKKTVSNSEKSIEKTESKSQGANIGNDLMADLHAKLALRRKGISGTRSADGVTEVNTAMNRISAMIPPPVPAPSADLMESATEDDGEWDE